MSCGNQYVNWLRARGFRITPQRMTILHVLHHADGHIAPTEVYRLASRELPGLTEATVYRTLELLAAEGLVRPAHMGGGHLEYEIGRQAHHHLICRQCGSETEIDHALLEPLYADLESASGYRSLQSHLTFFGLCPECLPSKPGE